MARSTRAAATMDARLQGVIDRGLPVSQTESSARQFVRDAHGDKILLMNADNTPTKAGRSYYKKLGVDVPTLYEYDQPLHLQEWITTRTGAKLRVRKRGPDGQWVLLPQGVAYFKFNRSEFAARVPYRIAKDPSGTELNPTYEILASPPREQYAGLKTHPTLTVGQVRKTLSGNHPLHAESGSLVRHNEVRAAAAVIIRTYDTLVGNDGVTYYIIDYDSFVIRVWDTSRQILVNERRTNFWDSAPTTT